MDENDEPGADQRLTVDTEEEPLNLQELSDSESEPEFCEEDPRLLLSEIYFPSSSSIVKLPSTQLVAPLYVNKINGGLPQPLPGCYFGSSGSMFSTLTMSEAGTSGRPFCRICFMPDEDSLLFSPCRCSGSLTYVHQKCIKKWVHELSKKRKTRQPRCEICQYKFRWRNQFKWKQWSCPHISRRDQALHAIFVLFLFIIIGCVVSLALCGIYDTQKTREAREAQRKIQEQVKQTPHEEINVTMTPVPTTEGATEIRTNDIITISCAILFIMSTFVCWFVEWNAKHSVIKVYKRFKRRNNDWLVEPYLKIYDDTGYVV